MHLTNVLMWLWPISAALAGWEASRLEVEEAEQEFSSFDFLVDSEVCSCWGRTSGTA